MRFQLTNKPPTQEDKEKNKRDAELLIQELREGARQTPSKPEKK